jgi:hypothetical protein
MTIYNLQPIRYPVKYITELFENLNFDPRLAIADSEFGREYNIYHMSIAPLITDVSNYWIVWGGYFDNPVGYGLQIFLNRFLIEVFTAVSLEATENSFYIDIVNDKLYMNISLKPWQYADYYASLYSNEESSFTNAPKDETNPSDIYYNNVKVLPRMKTPSFQNKLNDVISGVATYNDFSVIIDNADGKYDSFDIENFFNTLVQTSKSTENAQSIEDFNLIRRGFINDIPIDFGQMQIKGVDQFYLMNKDFCRKFSDDDYPNIPSGNINDNMPVAWGVILGAPLIEVNRDSGSPCTWIEYIALDPVYITAVTTVYDSDGNSLTFNFTEATGVIRTTEVDGEGEAIEGDNADVSGKADNKLGQVIIDALAVNENLAYVDGVWDIAETDRYLDICVNVDFYFGGGTTRELIESVLKNDLAYLIQKNNGLLTLRQWGQNYDIFVIRAYLATKKPKKNFKDAYKYFCSTVKILSDKNIVNDNYESKYIDDSQEISIFSQYKKSYTAEFKTDLINQTDIEDLANRLLDRFGLIRETLRVGLGVDTYQINLLDKIRFAFMINDREFSKYNEFIVKETNPGQDMLTMEGLKIGYVLTFDGVSSIIDTISYIQVFDVN